MNADTALSFLMAHRVFDLEPPEIEVLYPWLARRSCARGETVFNEGEPGTAMFVAFRGRFQLIRYGWVVRIYEPGESFGEVSLLDRRERTGTVTSCEESELFTLTESALEDPEFPPRLAARIFRYMGQKVSSYLRTGADFYKTMDTLLIQDGGCAPGYNTVTAFLAEYLEQRGRKVYIAREGFKSLVHGQEHDFGALISDQKAFESLDHVPGVIFAPPLRDRRGAMFRTERFPEFQEEANRLRAADLVLRKQVKVLVGIGGDGTFHGMKGLVSLVPRDVQIFFVPVTIDSDISATECIGQHTGVEMGAEKIRCYLADAATHHRCYLIEMMGANGGYHALHSCIGAGAHLAMLPGSQPDLARIAQVIGSRRDTVVVVAEGYKREERKRSGFKGSAAEWLHQELLGSGLEPKKKVVCESFSRDIRGASPNNIDVTLSQQMARKVAEMAEAGMTCWMPSVESGRVGAVHFDQITRDNSVESEAAGLADRL